jgi:hypothetical protein
MEHYRPLILSAHLQKQKITVFMDSSDYNIGATLIEHAKWGNPFVETFEYGLSPEGYHHKSRVVWAGNYAPINLYNQCTEYSQIRPSTKSTKQYRFILNHSKKLYVDKESNADLHPLPFLTAEGFTHPGPWARDVISVERQKPVDFNEFLFYLE